MVDTSTKSQFTVMFCIRRIVQKPTALPIITIDFSLPSLQRIYAIVISNIDECVRAFSRSICICLDSILILYWGIVRSLCVCECVQIIWRKCNTKVHLTIYIWIDKSLSNPSTIADVLLIHYWKNNVEISQSENMQRKSFGLF